MKMLDADSLKQLCDKQQSAACSCSLRPSACWESFTEDRWPKDKMTALGTLRDPDIYEPTQEEFHPDGTRYASPDAPVAVKFFPYNVCDVYECRDCHKPLLRYTEFGGYYVDHRVREIDPELIK
ncbi:MAG: hypothetical protein V4573_14260 [Pseudomonadota bacterium]